MQRHYIDRSTAPGILFRAHGSGTEFRFQMSVESILDVIMETVSF
jgi:hypothetical protein